MSMKRIPLPSSEFLNSVFSYCSDTGDLTWRVGRFAGKNAGSKRFSKGENKYVMTSINYQRFVAHRVIWVMVNGAIPEGLDIDHIDGDTHNNRISNLRLATPSQNLQNSRGHLDKTSGLPKGVWRNHNGYSAAIRENGNRRFLGMFKTPDAAGAAYLNAARKAFGEFARA